MKKSIPNNIDEQSIMATLRTITIIFFAFLSGMLVFAGIATYQVEIVKTPLGSSELDEVFQYIVPILALAGLVGSKLLYRSLIQSAKTSESSLKPGKYVTAAIIQYALLEGPFIFSVLGYFLTANRNHLITAAILLLLYIPLKPSAEKMKDELNLW